MSWEMYLLIVFIIVMLAPVIITLVFKAVEFFLAGLEVILYMIVYLIMGFSILTVTIYKKLSAPYRK